MAAHYAISSVFGSYPDETVLFCYTIRRLDYENVTSGRARLAIGRCRITSNLTEETEEVSFAALHFGDHNVTAAVERSTPQDLSAFDDLKQKCSAAVTQANLPEVVRLIDSFFGGSPYSLASLFKDDQRRILRFILNATLSEVEDSLVKIYEEHASLLHFLNASGLPKPPALTMAAGFAINAGLRRALEEEPIDLARVRSLISLAKSDGVVLESHALRYLTDQHMKRAMVQLQAKPLEPDSLDHALTLARTLRELPFELNLWQAQNIWYDTLTKSNRFLHGPGSLGRRALEGELSRAGPSAVDRGRAISGGGRVAGRRGMTPRWTCAACAQGHGSLTAERTAGARVASLRAVVSPSRERPANVGHPRHWRGKSLEGASSRQRRVTGPSIGCCIARPLSSASSRARFNAKYHFAGRSASSISIRPGLNLSPSACCTMVSWSWRTKRSPKNLAIAVTKGTP